MEGLLRPIGRGLLQAPEDEKIAELYSRISENPNFFQAFDQEFADTPLHSAAAHGQTQLALEIQRLRPSFGQKLNANGLSPLHLALLERHFETVSAMIKLNPELVRVQGREGITPLHHAAQTNNIDMLAEFLLSCPDSIEDLTVRMEGAAHVAVKYGKLAAFRVLLSWLKRTGRREVLRWRDWEGNSIFHLAVSANQPEVLELLVKEACINSRNLKGLTALDIAMELPAEVKGRAVQILRRNGAKTGSSTREATFARYLRSELTIMGRIIKFIVHLEMGVHCEMLNTALLVAALIVGATYQGVFNWPDVLNNRNPDTLNCTSVPYNSSTTTNITRNNGLDALKTQGDAGLENPPRIMLKLNDIFVLSNFIGFLASVGTILLLLPIRRYSYLLDVCLFCLAVSYLLGLLALNVVSSLVFVGLVIVISAYSIFFLLIVYVKTLIMNGKNVRLAGGLWAPMNYVTYIYDAGLPQ